MTPPGGMGLQHDHDPFSNASSTGDLLKPVSNDQQTRSQELVLRLVKAAVAFGVPSHRLKAISHSIGHSMQCTANLYFLDNHAYLEFPAKTTGVPPALFPFAERTSMDFTKLSLLMSLLKKILRHPTQSSVDDLLVDLAQIEATPSAFSSNSIAVSYVFTATTGAIMFFHGNWKEAAMSGALATIPATLLLLANRFSQLLVSTLHHNLAIKLSGANSGFMNAPRAFWYRWLQRLYRNTSAILRSSFRLPLRCCRATRFQCRS